MSQVRKEILRVKAGAGGHRALEEDEGSGDQGGGEGEVSEHVGKGELSSVQKEEDVQGEERLQAGGWPAHHGQQG